MREIPVPIFKDGQCVYQSPSVMEIRELCRKEKDTLWEEVRRLVNPHEVYVDLSEKLLDCKETLFHDMSQSR